MRCVGSSLTLLNLFVLTSGAILLVGALVLGSTLTKTLWSQSVRDGQADVAEYADTVFGTTVVQGDRIVVDDEARRLLERHLRARPDLLSVKLWSRDGRLLWASVGTSRIGQRFQLTDELRAVLRTAQSRGQIGTPAGGGSFLPEDGLQVYAPVRGDWGTAIGAYEIYVDSSSLSSYVADGVRTVWLLVGGVFALLYVVILLLARGASRRLRQQTAALRARSAELEESYLRLQENSLGAIESLNATVEAKDPYTAGHSQRVRRIALAIGRELELEPERHGATEHERALPRHRQDRRPRRHPHEAGPARRGRVRADQGALREGRRDRRQAAAAGGRGAGASAITTSASTDAAIPTVWRAPRSRSRRRSSASPTPGTR